jgi:hypothetical protein
MLRVRSDLDQAIDRPVTSKALFCREEDRAKRRIAAPKAVLALGSTVT